MSRDLTVLRRDDINAAAAATAEALRRQLPSRASSQRLDARTTHTRVEACTRLHRCVVSWRVGTSGHAAGCDVGCDKTVYLMTYWHVDRHFSN